MMSELIVAGYDDAHTAFMASAALARMEKELALNRRDIAVVSLEEDGEASVREAINLTVGKELHETLWKTLTGLLFSGSPADDSENADTTAARLSAIGLDDEFVAGIAKTVKPGTSAVLVLTNTSTTRNRVIGILRGFKGRITKARLNCEDGKQCLDRLMGR